MTLEELIKQDSDVGLKEAMSVIAQHVKEQESAKMDAFLETLKGISEAHTASNERLSYILGEHGRILKKISERPDPKYPEFPPFPEQKEFPPFPEFPEIPEQKDISPLIEELIETIKNEQSATRDVLIELLNKEPDIQPVEEKAKTIGGGIGSIRRRARWEIATLPAINGKAVITAAGDGLTFYLPFAPIPNSETIRLNGGLPLSNGVDYTLTGNKLVFVQDQTNSLIEMRAQK